ncbi:hypothetical protein FE257_001151 [Aspergillus nanangensis]|uniref:Phosphoglycerate mutase family protein n=1 Tax=Aspergillus nanangensis TaxID=2582783 RepID=A0AAD4CU40_ASPNN|nr:hypothetical protein FE257_001151 [Aspergillus nanangensis]
MAPSIPLYLFLVSILFVFVASSATHHPTLYLIRHGEKSGDPKDDGLNADGVKRAQCLRDVFGASSPYQIGYIMAPKVNSKGEHRRSYETVAPLAKDLGLPVDTSCRRNHARCVARRIRNYRGSGNILVSWRHSKIKDILKDLKNHKPPEYPGDRFDLIWTLPYPFDNITDIRSEACPELDVPLAHDVPLLKIQI